MTNSVYQFKHIFQFYCQQRQLAYAKGNMEQGKQFDKYATIYFSYIKGDV